MVLQDEFSIASYSAGRHYSNFMLTIENAPDGLLFAELQVPDERCSPLFLASPGDFLDVLKGVAFRHKRRGFSLEFKLEGDRVRVAYEVGQERSSTAFLVVDYQALLDKLLCGQTQSV